MRIIVALALLLLPLPAAAQSLGSYTSATAPRPRFDSWGGRPTQPRGGYRTERRGTPPPDLGAQREIGKIREDIRDARESGQISRKEARLLMRQSGRLGGFAHRSASGGLSYAENSMIAAQMEMLRGQLTAARTRGLTRQR